MPEKTLEQIDAELEKEFFSDKETEKPEAEEAKPEEAPAEPTKEEVEELVTKAVDLVQDTGTGKPLSGTLALGKGPYQSGKWLTGTGGIQKSGDEPTGRGSVKESIRKLVRKHTKAPERLALEESIRRSLHTVLTQD